ncbi:hypothetical protein HH303_07765 [Rhodospirillaceae bacterium KN72]|uniref:Solute-binding protein family 3/N-terminal domain-containing protein n=1 Tax=Pacificispira spongiicola TaxID=2729598 RepID=A0A7Y0E0T1_9PROT|nr:hypothetical protein [Pacificispira spongiicola]NMM44371.1 hypothetical protein [Pacificispira spongiicola]
MGLQPGDEHVISYEIGVLRMALTFFPTDTSLDLTFLENTRQKRLFYLLEHGSDEDADDEPSFDVVISANSRDREDRFLQVAIPLTRGLLGKRVLVIRSGWNEGKPLPCDLETLRTQITIGSGTDWPDSDVFEAAGFPVARASYEGLWRMLEAGRFDGLNRGIQEVEAELARERASGRSFSIEGSVLFSYRQDYFLYVRKDNRALHDKLETALQAAYDSGTFMENFRSDPGNEFALALLNDPDRCEIDLHNPNVSNAISTIGPDYWE